jgi:hypothetical protein
MIKALLTSLARLCGFFDSLALRGTPCGAGKNFASNALGHMTTLDPKIASAIQARLQGIREWMAEEAPYSIVDQRHLDANTPERAYWHLGYQAALQDVLDLADGRSSAEHRSGDKSS